MLRLTNLTGFAAGGRAAVVPPPPPPSVPVFESYSSNSGGGSALTIGPPSGLVDDDVMLGLWGFDGSANITGTPSGWTELYSFDGSRPCWLGWKKAQSEAGSYTVNISTGQGMAGAIHRISGAHLTSPIDVTSHNAPSSATNIAATSVTPTVDACLLLALLWYDDGRTVIDTYPGGMASIHNVRQDDAGSVGTGAAEQDLLDTSATGAKTFVMNNAEIARAWQIAIAPA